MYRVMVVDSNMDDPGSVSRAIDRGNLIPYDSNDYAWGPACKVREAALKLFPAVIIIWSNYYFSDEEGLIWPNRSII